jgi:hypothetical protein
LAKPTRQHLIHGGDGMRTETFLIASVAVKYPMQINVKPWVFFAGAHELPTEGSCMRRPLRHSLFIFAQKIFVLHDFFFFFFFFFSTLINTILTFFFRKKKPSSHVIRLN